MSKRCSSTEIPCSAWEKDRCSLTKFPCSAWEKDRIDVGSTLSKDGIDDWVTIGYDRPLSPVWVELSVSPFAPSLLMFKSSSLIEFPCSVWRKDIIDVADDWAAIGYDLERSKENSLMSISLLLTEAHWRGVHNTVDPSSVSYSHSWDCNFLTFWVSGEIVEQWDTFSDLLLDVEFSLQK